MDQEIRYCPIITNPIRNLHKLGLTFLFVFTPSNGALGSTTLSLIVLRSLWASRLGGAVRQNSFSLVLHFRFIPRIRRTISFPHRRSLVLGSEPSYSWTSFHPQHHFLLRLELLRFLHLPTPCFPHQEQGAREETQLLMWSTETRHRG